MFFRRTSLGLVLLGATMIVPYAASCAVAQNKPPVIPDFPGATTPAPAQQPAPAPPAQSAPAPVPDAAPADAVQSPAEAAKPLTKAEEKALKKKQKEEEKKAKEAEQEKNFLKLQGEDIVAPTLDADGKPIMLQPCAKKDKVCQKKRKGLLKRKTVGMKLSNGTLTVDGWTGKARLNYDISEVKFLYISVPGLGTVIVGMQRFPGSVEEKDSFSGNTMTVTTPDGHSIQISSDKSLLGNKKPESAWVLVDASYTYAAKYPMFGYGSSARAPYNWPGGRPLTEAEKKLSAKAPPLPKGLEAKQMVLPCQKVNPGEQPKPVKINGIMMTPPACPQETPKQQEPGYVH